MWLAVAAIPFSAANISAAFVQPFLGNNCLKVVQCLVSAATDGCPFEPNQNRLGYRFRAWHLLQQDLKQTERLPSKFRYKILTRNCPTITQSKIRKAAPALRTCRSGTRQIDSCRFSSACSLSNPPFLFNLKTTVMCFIESTLLLL